MNEQPMTDKDHVYYYKRGNSYYDIKNYEKAIQDYKRAIELNDKEPAYYYKRGNAYNNIEKYENAIENFTEAIELNKKNYDYYYNRGNAYGNIRDHENAIKDFTKAIELNGKEHAYYYNRGSAYNNIGKYEKSIEDFTKAIRLNDKEPMFYNSRGSAYNNIGKYEKSIEDLTKAIELNDKEPKYYSNRGLAYTYDGDYEKAIQDYKRAIELNDKEPEYYSNKGLAYTYDGDYEKAIYEYDEAIKLNKYLYNAYIYKALTYKLQDDKSNSETEGVYANSQVTYNELFDSIVNSDSSTNIYIYDYFKYLYDKYNCKNKKNNKPIFLQLTFSIMSFLGAIDINTTKYTTQKTFDKIYKKKKKYYNDTSTENDSKNENNNEVESFSQFTINIASSMNDANEGKTLFHYLHNGIDCNDFYNKKHSVFISSFTENPGDSIGMWNSQYGDICKGISFTFNTSTKITSGATNLIFSQDKKTTTLIEDKNKKSQLSYYRVIYYNKDNKEYPFSIFEYDKKEKIVKKQEKLSEKISKLFEELKTKFDKLDKNNIEFLKDSLLMLSYLVKNISYYNENEVRLLNIVFNNDHNDVQSKDYVKQIKNKVKRYDDSNIVYFETDHIIRPKIVTLSPFLTKDPRNRDNYQYVFDYNVDVRESEHPFNIEEKQNNNNNNNSNNSNNSNNK